MPSQLEKFPFFHPDNFQLEKLLNEITASHSFQNPESEGGLPVENAENENSAPPDSVGDAATLEDVIGNLASLNMTRIKEELKVSLEDLVAFYKSEVVSSGSSEEKSDTKVMSTASIFKTSEDFKMELRVLAKQISTLNEQFAEARHLNFQENIDELSLLKTQQSNLLSVKEILTVFEEIKRGEFDTLDFFVTSDSPSDLLKVI